MPEIEDMATITQQAEVLQAFSRVLGQETHVLTQRPDLLWQQMYNRLQWEGEEVKRTIAAEYVDRTAPGAPIWMRYRTPTRESKALIKTRKVGASALSPDGRSFVTLHQDAVRIWDTVTGEEKAALKGHELKVNICIISADGHSLLTGSELSTVVLWDIATGNKRMVVSHPIPRNTDFRVSRAISTCAISPNGRWVFSASPGSKHIVIWDVLTGTAYATLEAGMYGQDECAVSPDGRWFVSVSISGGHGAVWDFALAKEIYSFSKHPRCCAISPDGHWLVTGHSDGRLAIWDISKGTDFALKERDLSEWKAWKGHRGKVTKCAFSPDGQFIVSAGMDGSLGIWDSITGELLSTLTGHTQQVHSCVFGPDGNTIISASSDGTLKIWDATHRQKDTKAKAHSGDVTACVFSPDGTFVVSASLDKTLKTWDTASAVEKSTLSAHTGAVTCFSISPDSRILVSGGDDHGRGRLIIWDVAAGKRVAVLEVSKSRARRPDNGEVRACVFSSNGDWLVSLSARYHVWDILSGKEKYRLKGHDLVGGPFDLLEPGHGNFWVLKIGKNEVPVYQWKLGDEKWRQSQEAMNYAFAISPDARWIVTAGAQQDLGKRVGNLRVWHAASGKLKTELRGYEGIVDSCSFSPDGRSVISAQHGTIKLWNIPDGKERMTIETGGKYGSTAIHISPDGAFFIAYSKVWDMVTGKDMAVLGGHDLAISPDGRWIVTLRARMVQLLEATTGKVRAEFPLNDSGRSVAWHPAYPFVVCGETGGALHFLELAGFRYGPLIVTASRTELGLMVRCPSCQQEHAVSQKQLGSEISCPTRNCDLRLKPNTFVIEPERHR